MKRLMVAWVLAVGPAVAQVDVAKVARDPIELAKYLDGNGAVDWEAIKKTLGMDWTSAPMCGDEARGACSVELFGVVRPDQRIVLAEGRFEDIYIRFLRNRSGAWQFAGYDFVEIHNHPRRHEIERVGGVPFLKISSQRNRGSGLDSESEEWFDLTLPGFDPVFEFLPNGSISSPTVAIGWRFNAVANLGPDSISESIGVEFFSEQPEHVLGRLEFHVGYRRAKGAKEFKQTSVTLNGKQSPGAAKELASILTLDDEPEHPAPSEEDLVRYDIEGLKAVATGKDDAAKAWLREFLKTVRATAEVVELRRLVR